MIIKIKKYTNGNYTQISNNLIRDNSISLLARGLLVFMLSCKEDIWEFSVAKLIKNTNTSNEWVISEIPDLRDNEPL